MGKIDIEHAWEPKQWDWPMQHHDGVVKVINEPTGFEVALEVHYFKPDEITVTVQNHELTVHALHDERSDHHGRISRSVQRTYHLPADVNVSSIKSRLSDKGVLHVTASKQ